MKTALQAISESLQWHTEEYRYTRGKLGRANRGLASKPHAMRDLNKARRDLQKVVKAAHTFLYGNR